MKKETKNRGTNWLKAVGQSTLIRVDWMDWKKEQPKPYEDIIVIVKGKDNYSGPFHATYFDETIPAGKTFPETRFRRVDFREMGLGAIYLGSKEEKYLVAWGRLVPIIKLAKECTICKRIDCIC
jgi:hypothetical protein